MTTPENVPGQTTPPPAYAPYGSAAPGAPYAGPPYGWQPMPGVPSSAQYAQPTGPFGQIRPTGLTILDLGCGRADLLDFLINRGTPPKKYIGLEGVRELAEAAENKNANGIARIIIADFVREPRRMQVSADVIYCSGALNTIETDDFYATIRNAFTAAKRALVFNFLSSSLLAGTNYLRWHNPREVIKFCRTMTEDITRHEGYIEGDCTIEMRRT